MHKAQSRSSNGKLNAMLEYLEEETKHIETIEDLADVLQLVRSMLWETAPVNTVQGLPNIRAEVSPETNNNVSVRVPSALVPTFYTLSKRLNQLRMQNPTSYANAAKALEWIANTDPDAF